MAGLVPFNRKNNLLNKDFGDFYNMIDDFFADNWPYRRSLSRDTFKLDVEESDKGYIVEAELPGINKDEVNLEYSDGNLTISINREENVDEEKKNYIHKERRYSSMSRSVYLADAVHEGIKASLDNGVLKVNVPKIEKPNNSCKIEIE